MTGFNESGIDPVLPWRRNRQRGWRLRKLSARPSARIAMSLVMAILCIRAAAADQTTLKASVRYTADSVPQTLFGAWKRTRYITQSTVDAMIGQTEEGAWVIFRNGRRMMLRNPETGAETSVRIESVSEETVVFSYDTQRSDGCRCHERLTLTPNRDGSDLNGFQVKICHHPKRMAPYYQAFAKVHGVRAPALPPLESIQKLGNQLSP